MPLTSAFLCTALLAGFWAIERKAFLQAMLSRPVVVGACLGFVWGMPWLGLAIGSVLELFFLGAVNIGASLPGNELWAALAALAFAAGLSTAPLTVLRGPALLVLSICVGLPMARAGRHFDGVQERLNVRLSENSLNQGGFIPTVRVAVAGICLTALLAIAVSSLLWAAGFGVGKILAQNAQLLPSQIAAALDRAFGLAALSMALSSAAVALATLDVERALLIASITGFLCLCLFFALEGVVPWTAP